MFALPAPTGVHPACSRSSALLPSSLPTALPRGAATRPGLQQQQLQHRRAGKHQQEAGTRGRRGGATTTSAVGFEAQLGGPQIASFSVVLSSTLISAGWVLLCCCCWCCCCCGGGCCCCVACVARRLPVCGHACTHRLLVLAGLPCVPVAPVRAFHLHVGHSHCSSVGCMHTRTHACGPQRPVFALSTRNRPPNNTGTGGW